MGKTDDRVFPSRARVIVFLLLAVSLPLSIPAEEQASTVTLAQLIEEAMKNGPEVRLESASMAINRTAYDQTAAQNGFGLSATAGASRSNPFRDTTTGPSTDTSTERDPSDSLQAGLSLTGPFSTELGVSAGYTLTEIPESPVHSTKLSLSVKGSIWDGYLGGRGLAAVQQAGLTLRSNEMDHEARLKAIVYSLKQSYYTMLTQQRQIVVLQDTLSQRRNELARVQIMFDNHDATKIELRQAQLNAASAELDLRAARSGLSTAREKLSALVGRPAGAVYALAETEDLPVPVMDADTAVKTALEGRTDLAKLRLSRSKGDISLALQKAQYSPTVSASGGLSWSRSWTGETEQASWNAGVTVTLPIIDAGQTASQVRQAELQNETMDIQIAQLISSISTEVKDVLENLAELQARADLARMSRELAGDKYELAKARFDANAVSMLDLLTASVDLTGAQADLAKARGDVQLGVLALQNAIGN
jgi:outer membrane protein TolC